MNVLFISTDMDPWALGLRSISAVLKKAGHCTQLIFMPTQDKLYSQKNLDDLISFVRGVDIVGISCLARGSDKAKQIIDSLHPLNKLIVWGGVHASLNPTECAEWADIVCRGEGEGMMLELLERLQNGNPWEDIENAVYKKEGAIITNNPRPPISDLDTLPLPDFTFEHEYHLISDELIQVSTIPEVKQKGNIYFNGSRGCAFYCTYCCNEKLKNIYAGKNHYVRRMSIPRLIEHAQNLKKIFPHGKYFYFLDEDFAARPTQELIQFSDEYPQKVGLPFECLAHPSRINPQKMDLLTKAGLWRINMGIESGSERTRKEVYDRHVSNKVVKKAAETISSYPQVVPYYFMIIANPYEEREDLKETARLISELPYGSHVITYNLVFFPGSALYERAVQDGLIKGNEDSGVELDYLTGFKYKQHSWKTKNIYMNGLIFLMAGISTRYRLGIVPRFMIHALLRPQTIEFHEQHTFNIKTVILAKSLLDSIRHLLARVAKKFVKNPTTVYNLGYHLRKAFH